MKTVKSYWASLVSRWPDTEILPRYHPLRLTLNALYFLLGYWPMSLLFVIAVGLYNVHAGLLAYCLALVYVLACERIWLALYLSRYLRQLETKQSQLLEVIESTKASMSIVQSSIERTRSQVTALESETGVYAAAASLPPFLHLRKGAGSRALH